MSRLPSSNAPRCKGIVAVLSTEDDISNKSIRKVLDGSGYDVYEADFLLTGVMNQMLDFKSAKKLIDVSAVAAAGDESKDIRTKNADEVVSKKRKR